MNLPFSLQEAQNLCRDYQYLVGTPFDRTITKIQAVIVTPFDSGFKQRFFAYYLLFDNNAALALEEYKGTLYDVVVMAETEEGYAVNETLSVWAAKNNILINAAGNLVNQLTVNQAYHQPK